MTAACRAHGNDRITLYEPLLVPGVAAPPASVFDVQARPIVATVENASLVPPGAIRVYRYNP